jgi:hypothetical protein
MLTILIFSYFIVGFAIYLVYKEDVSTHVAKNAASIYIKRIIYIITFIVTMLLWPLLIGA